MATLLSSKPTINGNGRRDRSSLIHLRVLAASTGACYPITLHPSEFSVANIRSRLSTYWPIDDQILLLGPPYKVPKDLSLRTNETVAALHLGNEEDADIHQYASLQNSGVHRPPFLGRSGKTGAKRLFLFSRRALSEKGLETTYHDIDPAPGPLPMPISPGILSRAIPNTNSIHAALEVYERQFTFDLKKGQSLADGAKLRLSACRRCVAEQMVMALSLRAAVSNLAVHRAGAARERVRFTSEYATILSSHKTLFCDFESRLNKGDEISGNSKYLGEFPLHPSIITAASTAGVVMETLLDTVPLERERAWASKCQLAHERLSISVQELDNTFVAALGTSSGYCEELKGDLQLENTVNTLCTDIEDVGNQIYKSQAERLVVLSETCSEAKNILSLRNEDSGRVGGDGYSGKDSVFPVLEHLAQTSSSIIVSMIKDDAVLAELSKRVADFKRETISMSHVRLRKISTTQSAIARANSNATALRAALAQLNSDMGHLQHVVDLPRSYMDLIAEIRRRRAFSVNFRSATSDVVQKLESLRAEEIKRRENFLRGSGRHLMPIFFDLVPTLATVPPVFSPELPNVDEHDKLPDVGNEPDQNRLTFESDGAKTTLFNLEVAPAQRDVDATHQGPDERIEAGEKFECDKISHSDFAVGDVCLFMPTGRGFEGKRIYLAFHSNCPHRYLSPDCVSGSPDYLLGRIVFQEELTAGELQTESNPFSLLMGTKFWILSVIPLKL